jgi:hypothetical protein
MDVFVIWSLGMFPSYVYFKVQRVDHPILSALAWPVVGLVLLAGALTNPRSSIRRMIDDHSGPPKADSHTTPAAPPVDVAITRPKYGLIDSDET